MNHKRYLPFAAGLALLGGLTTVQAEEATSGRVAVVTETETVETTRKVRTWDRIYVSALASYIFLDSDRNVDDTFGGQLRLGTEINENWNVELMGGLYDDVFETNPLTNQRHGHDQWTFGLAGLYFIDRAPKFSPYLEILGGHARQKTSGLGEDRHDNPIAAVGAGFFSELTKAGTAIRGGLQLRYDPTDLPSPQSDQDNLDVIVSIGISQPFWGGSKTITSKTQAEAQAVAPVVVVTTTDTSVPDVNLQNVHFEHDSTELLPAAKQILNNAAVVLKANGGTAAIVEGHASAPGDDGYNLNLSQQRAQVVAAYLVGKGVSRNSLSLEAYGETRPVADNATQAGQAANRRVEVKVRR